MRKLKLSTLTFFTSLLLLNACGMPGPLYQTEKQQPSQTQDADKTQKQTPAEAKKEEGR
ncbi:hypothetical protein [Thalassotalea ganghwensis]